MLTKAARSADSLAKQLPETVPGKAACRAHIARLGNECGCAMGGAFSIAAGLLVVVYAALFGELSLRFVVIVVVLLFLVFVVAMLGKLTGMLIALARLALLRIRLENQLAGIVVETSLPGDREA